jgi:hypothetical protein
MAFRMSADWQDNRAERLSYAYMLLKGGVFDDSVR